MTKQSPDQLALCSWSLKPKSAAELVERTTKIGLKKVQLGLNPLTYAADNWSDVKRRFDDAGMTIVSGMFNCAGDDYTSPQTIRETGGIVPDRFWDRNWQIVQDASRHAESLAVTYISTHIGFLPHETSDPNYPRILDRVRRMADHLARSGQTLLFETGQETADTLWTFLGQLERANVGVNFDPANMISYDMGDPIQSLRKLMPRVMQCHMKDSIRTKTPGTWGTEVPVGEGEVNWSEFVKILNENNFTGPLVIEREIGTNRDGDVRKAVEHLSALMS